MSSCGPKGQMPNPRDTWARHIESVTQQLGRYPTGQFRSDSPRIVPEHTTFPG